MPADPLRSLPKIEAAFVEPMDWLPVPSLPQGSEWIWESQACVWGDNGR